MEKQKTALNQFIEWYNDTHRDRCPIRPSKYRVIEKATELLEAEKQQMGQSFDAGFNQNVYIAGKDYEKYKDKFFTETFENSK